MGGVELSPRRHLVNIVRVTVGLVLLATIGVLAARSLDWGRTWQAITNASGWWLLAGVLLNAVVIALWGGYWQRLTPRTQPVRYARMFEIVAVTSSVMNTVPFGAGHATGAVLLVKRGGMTAHGALSVSALDQLGEGVAKTMIYLLVALLAPLPVWMHRGIFVAASGVALLLVVLLVAAHWYADHPGDTPVHSETALGRAREHLARWASGLEALRSWRQSGAALLWVLGMKAGEIAGIWAVQLAFAVHIGFGATLLAMAAKVLGTMIPLVPGNVGTFEASMFLAYRFIGVRPELAAAMALAQHACFMVPNVGVGYAIMLARTTRSPGARRSRR